MSETVTIPPSSFDFALPRTICDSEARVGDTVTTLVTLPAPVFLDQGRLYGIGRDTTISTNLKAFLRVSRVGAATRRDLFRVDFVADSFALDGRRGRVAVSRLRAHAEAVESTLLANRTFVDCYGGRLRGETAVELVLRAP